MADYGGDAQFYYPHLDFFPQLPIMLHSFFPPVICSGGGGGFFLMCKDLGRMFDNSFPTCAFFFFNVEISVCTQIPLFTPKLVHSGSVS